MSETVTVVSKLSRAFAAVALALAWVAAAGMPAAAEVTEWGVESPHADAVIAQAEPLVVYVNRTASPEEERVDVRTRVLDAAGEPVSERVVSLELTEQIVSDPPGSDQLRYSGEIAPESFVWLGEEPAPNGSYTLQVQLKIRTGDVERDPTEWRNHPFRLDAAPQPPGAVTATVKNAEKMRMTVTWEPSQTVDLSHYILERRVDGGAWGIAQDNIDPTATSFTDTVDAFGDYRYRVIAARPSGDGSGELRLAESPASSTVEIEPAPAPPPVDDTPDEVDAGGQSGGAPEGNSGQGGTSDAPPRSRTSAQAPVDANTTYKGPLDYGVEPETKTVTERVPVEVAKGGTQEGGVLEVVDRSIDRQRVLPAVAGGLILVLSAAHVVRFLNE